MIHSMTGFGRADFAVSGLRFEVEVRTVNHRHLDVRARLPRPLADRELEVKQAVGEALSRGKVDVTVSLAAGTSSAGQLDIDAEVAAQYVNAAADLRQRHQLSGELDVVSLLSLPGVTRFVEPGLEPDALTDAFDDALRRALDGVLAMRRSEGEALARDVGMRLERLQAGVDEFETRSGEVVTAARERLRRRTEQIRQETGLLDEARLHQEIVIAADRLDISEELARLKSHIAQFRETLASADVGKPVGRRLDFLLQELARETNTVGSKANDAPLAQGVVDLKTELERIREQVQNVE